jgi:hypothetical protein
VHHVGFTILIYCDARSAEHYTYEVHHSLTVLIGSVYVVILSVTTENPKCRKINVSIITYSSNIREEGRIVGGKEWQLTVFNTEEWNKLLRTRSRRILHSGMDEYSLVPCST